MRTSRRLHRSLGLLWVLAGVCNLTPASASPNYTLFLQLFLGLESEPPCTLCHRDNDGGDATVVEPFGLNVMLLGATGNNDTRSLEAALRQMNELGTDSDGDGTPDINEIQAGSDPNIAARVEPPAEVDSPDPASPGAGGERPTASGADMPGDDGSQDVVSTGSPHEAPPPTLQTGCTMQRPAGQPTVAWSIGWIVLAWLWRIRWTASHGSISMARRPSRNTHTRRSRNNRTKCSSGKRRGAPLRFSLSTPKRHPQVKLLLYTRQPTRTPARPGSSDNTGAR